MCKGYKKENGRKEGKVRASSRGNPYTNEHNKVSMSSEAHDKPRSDVAPESLRRTCRMTTHRDCMLVSETSYRGQRSEFPELPKDICFQIKDNQIRPMLEPSVHVRVPRDVVIEKVAASIKV